jgi:3-dehydroquinate synthase
MNLSQETIELNNSSYKIILSENFEGLSNEIKLLENISSIFVISESNIYKYYKNELETELKQLNIPLHFLEIKGKEQNKHISKTVDVYNQLITLGADRKSIILALGGGVVGDFTGFIASTYQRGVRFLQIPTTLLACVDSSVGGKVAVNADKGKNMIGAFHQPVLVFAPLHTLKTLPKKEWRCGLSEVIKHSLLQGGNFFDKMKFITSKNYKDIENIVFFIKESVKYKASIVQQDPFEKGVRAVLNLGHTLGHAIESLTSYKKYTHGEAISIGLVTALMISERKFDFPVKNTQETISLMNAIGLPFKTNLNSEDLINHMKHDKKNSGDKIFYVLLNQIGKPEFGVKISPEEIKEILHLQNKINII